MATLKYSRQRESIKEFLRSRTDHPTADTVYENLRQIYPNISLGTVYRNLSLLSDIGEIRKLTNFGSADRYDGRVAPHSHFINTYQKFECIWQKNHLTKSNKKNFKRVHFMDLSILSADKYNILYFYGKIVYIDICYKLIDIFNK